MPSQVLRVYTLTPDFLLLSHYFKIQFRKIKEYGMAAPLIMPEP